MIDCKTHGWIHADEPCPICGKGNQVTDLKKEIDALKRENERYKEALKSIQDMGTNSYVDPDTNLWEKQISREAEIAAHALEGEK